MNFNNIKKIIRDAFSECVGYVPDDDELLLSTSNDIPEAFFLYIFDYIEKQLGRSVCFVFHNTDYSIMTISNLAKIIHEQGINMKGNG